jgi:dTDP-4-dehydrorhamnose reductase
VKALIVGGQGQLGRALMQNVPAGVQGVALGKSELDLTDAVALGRNLDAVQPTALINAAAYTAVDQAESEPQRAYAVNAEAVGAMARACRERRIRLVHVSTDFVFDGVHGRPYRPDDPPNPLSVYGASKLEGERRVAAEHGLDWRVIRTAWVYAAAGRNFVLTMLRLFRERPVVRVVADQVGTPTSAGSLAECVWRATLADDLTGILHFTDAGVASWYDFAVAICEEAATLGLVTEPVDIVPIATEEYPTAARRPSYSLLDSSTTLQRLNLTPVHWRTRLRQVLKELRA